MTRVELIQAVGDALTNLDLIRFDLSLSDPRRPELNAQRKALDDLLDVLVDAEIDDSTPAYAEASALLGPLNEQLKATTKDLDQLKAALEAVVEVLGVVKQVAGVALPLLPV